MGKGEYYGNGGKGRRMVHTCFNAGPQCSAATRGCKQPTLRRTGISERVSKRGRDVGRGRRLVAEKLATALYCIGLISGLVHEIKANNGGRAALPSSIWRGDRRKVLLCYILYLRLCVQPAGHPGRFLGASPCRVSRRSFLMSRGDFHVY